MRYDRYEWRPYVSVAERRRKAVGEMAKLRKKGHPVSPVTIEGRAIAKTFWGKAWCDNLERYSDFSNRLPRGRTYIRNGSVVDLQFAAGAVTAFVSGSALYKVTVNVSPVAKARWTSICRDTAGSIDSLVELLQGRFSKGVMERICQRGAGLFPSPGEISFSCSCPDWASMCKHVAAVLYGIGARLDDQPELLFRLRKVDGDDLIAKAGAGVPLTTKGPAAGKVLQGGELAGIFGLEMADSGAPEAAAPIKAARAKRAKAPTRKTEEPARAAGESVKRVTRGASVSAKRKVNGKAARKKPATKK